MLRRGRPPPPSTSMRWPRRCVRIRCTSTPTPSGRLTTPRSTSCERRSGVPTRPIYVAVLPAAAADAAGGDPAEVAQPGGRRRSTDPGRTPSWWATASGPGSSELPAGRAGELADGVARRPRVTTRLPCSSTSSIASVTRRPTGRRTGRAGPPTAVATTVAAACGAAGAARRRSRPDRVLRVAQQSAAPGRGRRAGPGRGGGPPVAAGRALGARRRRGAPRAGGPAASRSTGRLRRRGQPYRAAQAAIDYADEPVDLVRVRPGRCRGPLLDGPGAGDASTGGSHPRHRRSCSGPGPHGEPAVTLDERPSARLRRLSGRVPGRLVRRGRRPVQRAPSRFAARRRLRRLGLTAGRRSSTRRRRW